MNVGCIPKKLMHQTALLGTALQDAPKFGWQVEERGEHSHNRPRRSRRGDIGPACLGKLGANTLVIHFDSTDFTLFHCFFFSQPVNHNWDTMKSAVNDYIGSLNWGYRVALRDKSVNYVNAYAEFVEPHKIKVTFPRH